MTTNLFTLYRGDCIETMRFWLPDNSVDAIVTDPPYGLGTEPDALAMLRDWVATGHHEVKSKRGFMGKEWDAFVPQPVVWRECMRVLKPGGHLLAFAGTRTQDLVTLGLRIAGFEIRDSIAWVYGSGFPKSLDVSRAIEAYVKTGRSDSQVTGDGRSRVPGQHFKEFRRGNAPKAEFNPTTDAARQWQGWGTTLKPALEPITVARKPLVGTVAENVLAWGTGALNIDGCRVEAPDGVPLFGNGRREAVSAYANGLGCDGRTGEVSTAGRWPANLIHDGSEEPTGLLGEAARFFYCPKASKADRDEGCDELPVVESVYPGANSINGQGQRLRKDGSVIPPLRARNHHPTVKPTDLMRYLCRLVTPPGGVVLDPFMGSGSTGKAAMLEGFQFIGIEREAEYLEIARARISNQQSAA